MWTLPTSGHDHLLKVVTTKRWTSLTGGHLQQVDTSNRWAPPTGGNLQQVDTSDRWTVEWYLRVAKVLEKVLLRFYWVSQRVNGGVDVYSMWCPEVPMNHAWMSPYGAWHHNRWAQARHCHGCLGSPASNKYVLVSFQCEWGRWYVVHVARLFSFMVRSACLHTDQNFNSESWMWQWHDCF